MKHGTIATSACTAIIPTPGRAGCSSPSRIRLPSGNISKALPDYLSDDEYRRLQAHLIERPDAGAVIQHSGGVRKVRWAAGGKGKSGGLRVIYYWLKADGTYSLYSVGWNQADEGGQLVLEGNPPAPSAERGDWLWDCPAR